MPGIGMTSDRTKRRLIDKLRSLGVTNEAVLGVMFDVPRHEFIEEALRSHAYDNSALPIGHGQTISHPLTVALMTSQLLEQFPNGMKTVLEIGTGCGYQTAVVSPFAKKVVSIERIGELHRAARNRLYDLKVRNVTFQHADGFDGCSLYAPYDGILAAAVSDDVPTELVDQLAEGGRLVMPVKGANTRSGQELVVVDKTSTGIKKKVVSEVAFVPRVSGTI